MLWGFFYNWHFHGFWHLRGLTSHYVGPLYYWLTERGRRKFWEPKLWGSLGKPKHWKKNWNFFFSINFTQIFRICPKMFQFLKYLLHKQIIEMCHSQNLRRPLLVPCPTQCVLELATLQYLQTRPSVLRSWVALRVVSSTF